MSSSSSLTSPIRRVSRSAVRPPTQPSPVPTRCDLTVWDLAMLSAHYIQKGHLFSLSKPSSLDLEDIVGRLKTSLSEALLHFYPLAGRFADERDELGSSMAVYIDCNHESGAEFVRAVADGLTVADVVKPRYTPAFVRDFFCLDLAVNNDGHAAPLLAVQVTELDDGFFLGCSFNHAVGDGTSFWNFFNTWAEICRGVNTISRPPVLDRWFVDGTPVPIKLPFKDLEEHIDRFSPPELLVERIFHFSSESIAQLKVKANEEHIGSNGKPISSFQSLSALVWRTITRARRFLDIQSTGCRLAIDNRSRLRPPLSPDYFGNSIYAILTATTVGELLSHDLGWAAAMLNRSVASHTDTVIRRNVETWMDDPKLYSLRMFDCQSIQMGSSPRFDMYGCDFGWGKAVAIRSGKANKFDGKVSSYPGREGGGSVDLEICLLPEFMAALESDQEFMSSVSEPCFD